MRGSGVRQWIPDVCFMPVSGLGIRAGCGTKAAAKPERLWKRWAKRPRIQNYGGSWRGPKRVVAHRALLDSVLEIGAVSVLANWTQSAAGNYGVCGSNSAELRSGPVEVHVWA